MITIIAGGRDYQFTPEDRQALDDLHSREVITEVISGGQTGADSCGEAWADDRGIPFRRFRVTKAEWKLLGRRAGPLRNGKMAEVAEALVAFPGGDGTADMVRQARSRGLRVFDWRSGLPQPTLW